ncbi:hypothetical protein HGRIS_005973 [Hohenbuehelia grisea]|uniref:F-box domain-containing protein n=1 Tax=Hohenbuehelia grisea TaxID=104357 RepID=A0ABR3JYY0_9AGAR
MPPYIRLPAELIDTIVSHFLEDEDGTSLNRCSLVARPWRQPCQRLLLRSITIDSAKFHDFVAFLASSSHSSLASHTRGITLRNDPEMRSPPSEEQLATLASRLRRVSKLNLIKMDTRAPLEWWARAFPQCEELKLSALYLESIKHIFDLITALPKLQSLAINDVAWNFEPPEENVEHHLPPKLSVLKLHGCYTTDIVAWLEATHERPRIRSLDIGVVYSDHLRSISNLLQLLGSDLRQLAFAFDGPSAGWHADKFYKSNPLSANPRLQCVQIGVNVRSYCSTRALDHTPTFLAKLHLPCLDKLVFRLKISNTTQITYPITESSWRKLDDIVSGLKQLQRVSFELDSGSNPSVFGYVYVGDAASLIKCKMPLSTRMGRLSVGRSIEAEAEGEWR